MPTTFRRAAAQQERERRQARRLRAAELFAAGLRQAEVARQLGASRQSVSDWHARWQAGGPDVLRSQGPTGPTPRLSDRQLGQVGQVLLKGATANGFTEDLWTLDRVTLVIERLPAYAPDLNPVEGLWSSLKAVELANITDPTLGEVLAQAHRGIQRLRTTPHLAYSFLRHTGLSVS
jgi:transposase